MKKIASILLLIFSLVQVAPAFQSLMKESEGYFFNIDEEKDAEKSGADKKAAQKDMATQHAFGFLQDPAFDNHHDRQVTLQLSPFLEKPTPPPNC